MMKIKICGLTGIEDIYAVNRYRPDYAGFVFAKSKRRVTVGQAKVLVQALHPHIRAVGVFVNAQTEEMIKIARETGLHVIQLHGAETQQDILDIKARFDGEVWKAVCIENKSALERVDGCCAHRVLLDAGCGGSGSPFCWDWLSGVDTAALILAGGLNEGNIKEVAVRFAPYMVDISSGAETNGLKDESKIKRLIEIVRGAKLEQ